jgi:hypothetical protein
MHCLCVEKRELKAWAKNIIKEKNMPNITSKNAAKTKSPAATVVLLQVNSFLLWSLTLVHNQETKIVGHKA